jgi:hypothetical protein
MGMFASVLRRPGSDCTNGGVSSKYDNVVVINVPGPFEPTDRCPAVRLDVHVGNVVVHPVVPDGVKKSWFMMGGNFLYSSDSRFAKTVEEMCGHPFYGAVPIHDRVE